MVMFHGSVGNINSQYSHRYIGEGPGKIGPFSGYVIGGPNGNMKRLVEDENLDWRKNPGNSTNPISCPNPNARVCSALSSRPSRAQLLAQRRRAANHNSMAPKKSKDGVIFMRHCVRQ